MNIAVIGGGAAGLIAAGSALGANVVVFDHNDKVGKKIYITGKGRCNFTNVCDNETFVHNIVTNPMFIRSALSKFSPYDAIDFFENLGCATKVERGRRAFPLSDKASDITKALKSYAESNGAEIRLGCNVTDIKCDNGSFAVIANGVSEKFDKVIVCSGGRSYPVTGSDGSMYKALSGLGHNIIEPRPSLEELYTKQDMSAAEGLTLKNVALASREYGIKPIFGDLMITAKGISGPIALTLSAYAARRKYPFAAELDLKPAITVEELDDRLLRDFSCAQNKQFKNALDLLLPKSIIPFIIKASGIAVDRKINSITKLERKRLVEIIKSFELDITGNAGFDRAVVTSGGVDVKQIDPKTMGSRIVPGLYFGGEVMDVDALTGGYNFHIALATGYVAGKSAAE